MYAIVHTFACGCHHTSLCQPRYKAVKYIKKTNPGVQDASLRQIIRATYRLSGLEPPEWEVLSLYQKRLITRHFWPANTISRINTVPLLTLLTSIHSLLKSAGWQSRSGEPMMPCFKSVPVGWHTYSFGHGACQKKFLDGSVWSELWVCKTTKGNEQWLEWIVEGVVHQPIN